MSRYAYLVCSDCKVILWLGKAIFEIRPDQPSRFQIGSTDAGQPLNSEDRSLNKVVWKLLADHAGHPLHVLVEGEPGYQYQLDQKNVEIGGDSLGDISYEEYLKGWQG